MTTATPLPAPVSSAQEVYTQTVRALPPAERLRLAALILSDLTVSDAPAPPDYSDEWSDEDLRDAAAFSFSYTDEMVDKPFA